MTLLSCPKCPKAFSKPSHLQRHAHSHSQDRAFACELCGKRFTREDSKVRHIRRLHKSDSADSSIADPGTRDDAVSPGARLATGEIIDTGEEGTEATETQLHPWTVPAASCPAVSSSGLNHLERPHAVLDEDVARLLIPTEPAISRQRSDVASNNGFNDAPRQISQHSTTVSDTLYDIPMSGVLALDSAAQEMGLAEDESSVFGSSSYDRDMMGEPLGSGEHPNQLWQDIPTWEAALESDTFFDSWLQYDPHNSLATNAASFAPLSDHPSFQKDFSALSQSLPQQPESSHLTSLQPPKDTSAPASQPSPRTTAFWSQWLQIESAYSSPSSSAAQVRRAADGSSDIYSGLKSLVGSPAAAGHIDSSHTRASPSTLHSADSAGMKTSLPVISPEAEEVLPEDHWQTIEGEKAPISFSPDDQSSDLPSLRSIDGQTWESIRDRLQTSVHLSDTSDSDPDVASMLPGMTIGFLKSCLHLYFARFHPHFPVIHEPTFSPRYAPAYLCLMMIAIGSTFIGTGPTSTLGQWICRRVHRLMVNNREQRLASINSRVEFALAGVLGQTFSLLHGAPAELLTAEAFHGGVCGLVRRSGIMVSAGRVAPPLHLGGLQMSGQDLSQAWQRWALLESLHRTSIGLAIHAAELYQFSSVPGLLLRRVGRSSSQIESLFAAPTASAWKSILRSMSLANGNSITMSISSAELDSFHVHALLGQVLMDIHNSREMEQGCLLLRCQYDTPAQFYGLMIGLANECGIPCQRDTARSVDGRHHTFRALWHYCFVDYWSSSGDIEAAVGRYGTNVVARQALERLRSWVNTPTARLAALHAISVLEEAASCSDVNFLIPRAIYRSALLLFCVLSLADTQFYDPSRPVEMDDTTEWQKLAELCVPQNTSSNIPSVPWRNDTGSTPLALYVVSGGVIMARPLLTGQDRHTDIVSLLAGSMRLLTTSTQWGIGEVLAGLLAQISINAQS